MLWAISGMAICLWTAPGHGEHYIKRDDPPFVLDYFNVLFAPDDLAGPCPRAVRTSSLEAGELPAGGPLPMGGISCQPWRPVRFARVFAERSKSQKLENAGVSRGRRRKPDTVFPLPLYPNQPTVLFPTGTGQKQNHNNGARDARPLVGRLRFRGFAPVSERTPHQRPFFYFGL